MRVPRALWPERVRRFDETWTAWKRCNGLLDFTDLLEVALLEMPTAPGSPAVIFVDEAQDLSRLQLEMLRKWGARAKHLVTATAADQTIYGFAGAAPEVLLEKQIPQHHRTVLKQSYRVPGVVHAVRKAWIETVALREPKEYHPRDEPGELRAIHKGHSRLPRARRGRRRALYRARQDCNLPGDLQLPDRAAQGSAAEARLFPPQPLPTKKGGLEPLAPRQQDDDRRPAREAGPDGGRECPSVSAPLP